MRRTVGLAGGVLLIILLVIGINGCLDSRKDRAYRDYAGDVRSLENGSQDVSDRFFEVLSKPSRADALDVQTQVNAMRVDAEQLVDRAKNADHPDELNGASDDFVEALEFRADAIARVAELLPTALGDKGKRNAIELIAGQQQALLASDVIYLQRVLPELRKKYQDRGISERFPTARFLQDLAWLDPDTVETRLGKLSGTGKAATPGLHGTGLVSVTAKPSGTALTQQGVNRIPVGNQLSFDVAVQNGGESEETDVTVTVTIEGGKRISLDQVIPRIAAGQTETVSIPITQAPDTSGVSKVTVTVAPVPGESNKDNNTANYQVAFTK
jgi:CARDB